MGKISKLIKTLKLVTKQPGLINHILNSDDVWLDYIKNKKLGDSTLPIVDIENIIPNFNEQLDYFTFLGGGSLPTDIMLLKALAGQIKNCKYFEIGTFRGESVVNVSQNAKDCYTLNLSKQQIIDLKLPDHFADVIGYLSKDKPNITHLEGDSLSFDYKGLNKKFDLIFIDGNHTFDFVKSDTINVFKHLKHDNTIIVWHDYAYTPEKTRPEILAAILEGTPKEEHKNLYHVSNTLCAIYTKKNFETYPFEAVSIPKKTFEICAKVKPTD
jgi:predicted O-methyltransferase YrrM